MHKKVIALSNEITLNNVESMLRQFEWKNFNSNIEVDLSGLRFIEPVGLALLASYLLYLKVKKLFNKSLSVSTSSSGVYKSSLKSR